MGCQRLVLSLPLLLLLLNTAAAQLSTTEEPGPPDVIFDQEELKQIPEGIVTVVAWNTTVLGVEAIRITVKDPEVSIVNDGDNTTVIPVYASEDGIGGTFNVTALFLGFNTITVTLLNNLEEEIGTADLEMSVILSYQDINQIFTTSIGVLLAVVYINMGATIDLEVVKKIAKKPIGPIVGIVCQYGGMPLIAFGLSQIVFKDEPLFQLGMFMSGCVPGGGASNMWTHLLGGSLDLSIMMTFASTMVAFVAIPAWVLALGPVIASQADFVIPFKDIALLMVSLVVPCSIGLLVQRFLPRVTTFLEMTLTPFSIFNLLYIFTFGIYANRYIFSVIDARIWIAGLLLPGLGYLIGMVASLVLKLPRREVIAVSIETGIQNASIALFMLNFTLPAPAGTLAIVVPSAAVLMTPVPLMMAYISKLIYTKLIRPKRSDETKTKEDQETNPSKKTISTIDLPETEVKGGIDNPAAELSDQPA